MLHNLLREYGARLRLPVRKGLDLLCFLLGQVQAMSSLAHGDRFILLPWNSIQSRSQATCSRALDIFEVRYSRSCSVRVAFAGGGRSTESLFVNSAADAWSQPHYCGLPSLQQVHCTARRPNYQPLSYHFQSKQRNMTTLMAKNMDADGVKEETAPCPEGYRPNVGVCLVNKDNQVFVANRLDLESAWQMPQASTLEACGADLPFYCENFVHMVTSSFFKYQLFKRPPSFLVVLIGTEFQGSTAGS